MADKKIVEIVIKTDTAGVTKATDSLKKGIKETKVEADTLNESLGKTGSSSSAFDTLRQGAESLIPSLKGATAAGNGLLVKMYELIANPFGAVVAAIVISVKFLYESFQNTVAGGKELKAIFEGLDGVVTQAKDAFFAAGRAIMALDFSAAVDSIKNFGKEAENTFFQIKKLTEEQQKNDLARKKFAVVQAETNFLLVKSRDILTDETASLKEKRKALDEVSNAENKSSIEKVRIAQEDLRILKEKQKTLSGQAAIKMNQEIRDSEQALLEAKTENASTGVRLNRQEKMLKRQEKADILANLELQKEKNKKEKDLHDEKIKRENDVYYSLRRMQEYIDAAAIEQADKDKKAAQEKSDKVLADNNAELFSMATYQSNITAIENEGSEKRKKIAKNEKDAKLSFQLDYISAVGSAIGALGGLFEKGSDASKAAALVEIAINTGVGLMKGLTIAQDSAEASGPAAAFAFPIFYATQVAAVLGAASQAKSILESGNVSNISQGSNVAQTQAPRFNVVGTSGVNQLAQAVGQNQEPVKAYVVSSEISSQQSLDRNKIMSASLG
jgi:hypothetical protein